MHNITRFLVEAKNLLTEQNWKKGSYFSYDSDNETLCMCAHGAVQACANDLVKKIISPFFEKSTSSSVEATSMAAAAPPRGIEEEDLGDLALAAAAAAERASFAAVEAAAGSVAAGSVAAARRLRPRRPRRSTSGGAAPTTATDLPERVASTPRQTAHNNLEENFFQKVWHDCPNWINSDMLRAHYIMGMVGLTFHFNDVPSTSLDDIKDKFDQAIELSKVLTRE